ncbi:NADPH-dependent 2,4-dienoyl-CoA reductase, sulfur reductase [Ferrithrix thermotolerans DSM 19514]|uniref:NADPH-dependent 2,4-dienoyl-CoA reductase, sulfur reductase n=1 Tax=Ferrithrix thermotolerans DSM 19514 TaxID=1121881 RepID=A0A1M4XYR7_9ACTN|nr:FAD-dependent oxidoreductase [Ferrithrix thermotolerans]SHE98707.1 NADPH-dependent 2,4-dienoyl-CoA reductase, sulfur reductase [Ferrithrix thermotolerans DSM 19514]
MRVVIVGGSDAGVSAALRIKQLQPEFSVQILTKDHHPNYSVCGLPYLHSGEIGEFRDLFHRTPDDLRSLGIDLRLGTEVRELSCDKKKVFTEQGEEISYDTLILGTGVLPRKVPELSDLEDGLVHYLHSPSDGEALEVFIRQRHPEKALVVGAGYIGVEMAEAFQIRGIHTYLIEQNDQIFPSAELSHAERIQRALIENGTEVHTSCGVVTAKSTEDGKVVALLTNGMEVCVDVVVVAIGVIPNSSLARRAGIETNSQSAIVVDALMRTSDPSVLAAGDVVHTYHRMLKRFTYQPLGSTAHKQGAIAGEVASGYLDHQFMGSVGTQVVKVFEDVFATTGLKQQQSVKEGFTPLMVEIEADDHKAYYPGAKKISLSILGDLRSGKLLGVQMYGKASTAVHKRIDVAASALYSGLSVSELLDLDLSYNPPFGSPWDPLQVAAAEWLKRSGHFERSVF